MWRTAPNGMCVKKGNRRLRAHDREKALVCHACLSVFDRRHNYDRHFDSFHDESRFDSFFAIAVVIYSAHLTIDNALGTHTQPLAKGFRVRG